jgi:uncharacterized protein (DUF2141 family)
MMLFLRRSALLLFLLVVFTGKAFPQNVKLTIKITGIEEIKGKIQVGIYNVPEKFPKEGEQYKVLYLPVTSATVTQSIMLPPGNYAIALMHDEDADGECDMNFLGIPTEKYGFSNNVKPVLSAPSFEDAKFELKADKVIQIKLID